jgi:hypothetical protein
MAHRRRSADPHRATRRATRSRRPLQPRDRLQLYVTLKTVEGHLSRAYTKLGIERRGQLPRALEGEKTRVPTLQRTTHRPSACTTPTEGDSLMTTTTREAFEKGTDTFNAHDIDAFAEVLADDVIFAAPGGMRGEGKQPAPSSTAAASPHSPTGTSRSTTSTSSTTSPSRRERSPERITESSTAAPATSHQTAALSAWTTSRCSASATASTSPSTRCSTGS